MNITSRLVRFSAACLLLALGACGGGGSDDGGGGVVTPPPPPPQTGIGSAGGTVSGPNGSRVVIPAGALATNTDIKIEQASVGAPPLPAGLIVSGQMYAFTPHGTVFAVPVTITMPYDPATVPAGATPVLYKTNAQNQWEQIANPTFNADNVTAQIGSFSFAQVLIVPPLTRNDPHRSWQFTTLFSDGFATSGPDDNGSQVGGLLEVITNFGPIAFDGELTTFTGSVPGDGQAKGYVFGTANGATYGVYAEAPFGKLGGINQPGGPNPIGSTTRLEQSQSFIKRAADATLRFTLSGAQVCAFDYNGFPPTFGPTNEQTQIRGSVGLDVYAYGTITKELFFDVSGTATVSGTHSAWSHSVQTSLFGFTSTELWNDGQFDFTVETTPDEDLGVRSEACLDLSGPLTYQVDLSSVDVGEEFTLKSTAEAKTMNRRGGGSVGDHQGSGVLTFLRDPQSIGGTTIVFSGLEPTNRPDLVLPIPPPVIPAACVPGPGPDPSAGVLQFSAANFIADESPVAFSTVSVTRTGGSVGAVSATVTASDGTAIGDVDYTPVSTTVFFRDGETLPRLVTIPVVLDQVVEFAETVNLTLSQVGGCAALGAQTTAMLTILDDDFPPPPASGLDATFGTDGKASATAFGGDRSAMALQADGKIVIVGGTFTDFVLARFNADGTPDTSFDADGKVTTDMVSGEQEEALGVAIQVDGKIVVVGNTGTPGPGGPSNFAVARYNTNGSLDTSFGSGGKIVSGVLGNAYAVAIQPDGKIVVAGEIQISSGADFANFVLARYNVNGTLDASFGAAGQLATDIGAGTNTARNIVLQANGAIVVSGEPIGTFTGSDHTDVVRYDTNGNPDPSFGIGGKLTLNAARVGEGLALQGDGKLVLTGTVDVTAPPAVPGTVTEFAVRRLNADGSPDGTFGTAGAASTSISGQRDAAQAVALQSDGKIVVAGRSSNINVNFAVARFNSNGTLDTGFGGNGGGKLTVDFFGATDIAESVAVQPDGKIVLGGVARDTVDGYGLARVVP